MTKKLKKYDTNNTFRKYFGPYIINSFGWFETPTCFLANKIVQEDVAPIDAEMFLQYSKEFDIEQFNKTIFLFNNKYSHPALFLLIYHNRLDVLKVLLADDRIDPNVQDNLGYTPLHFAVWHNKVEIIDLLLSTKNVNATMLDDNNQSAVDIALNHCRQRLYYKILAHDSISCTFRMLNKVLSESSAISIAIFRESISHYSINDKRILEHSLSLNQNIDPHLKEILMSCLSKDTDLKSFEIPSKHKHLSKHKHFYTYEEYTDAYYIV